MKDHQKQFKIERMALALCVSRSGYYAWLKRPESARSIRRRELLEVIKEIFNDSRETYGSPRIHAELLKRGYSCGINSVARLMRENNICAKSTKKFKATTNSNHDYPVAKNNLDRKFNVNTPNRAFVSDITYIWTDEGWLYLCVVIDLFSRKIVGWSMSSRMKKELVIQAFLMTITSRKIIKGAIFHSDRGSQYASAEYQKLLKKHNFICSMSRKGNCWDNAVAESYFHSLKVEEVYQKRYRTRAEARLSIFEYIEVFYNRKRIHSYLSNMSPVEYEQRYRA